MSQAVRGKDGKGKTSTVVGVFYIAMSTFATFTLLLMNRHFVMSIIGSNNRSKGSPAYSMSQQAVQNDVVTKLSDAGNLQGSPTTIVASTELNLPQSSSQSISQAASVSKVETKHEIITRTQSTQQAGVVSSSAAAKPSTKSILDTSILCPAEVPNSYNKIPGSSGGISADSDMAYCKKQQAARHVLVGRSWGSLSKSEQMEWDKRKCNELLTMGKLQTCSEQWGWRWFDNWKNNQRQVMEHGSNVSCIIDYKTTSYCTMQYVSVDFSKAKAHGGSRSFATGFLTLYGNRKQFGAFPTYPGISINDQQQVPSVAHGDCEVYESRPAFVLSNDDIYNLGHYINDVQGIWAMTVLANRGSKESIMINIDGLRAGGPAGGGAHRLMVPSSPDTHGPYSPYYYSKWFNQIYKAVDFQSKKVCFRELYIFPLPGVAWFWNDWGRINECSMVAASPLYQSFNVFLRQQLMDTLGITLAGPPSDEIHIVIEVRKINPAKRAKTASGRFIRNLPALITALESIRKVRVTAQNFAELSFLEQIKLAHTASIFISMHGAGTTHIFHMAVGQKNCCGLIELFPDKSIDLYTAQGYGNLARMLGFHHERLVGRSGATTDAGTAVDVAEVKAIAERLIGKIETKPTCLHDVKDTRYPIYNE